MIPILYQAYESDVQLKIDIMSDTASAIVKEELNGEYGLTLKYPTTGRLYKELLVGRTIKAATNNGHAEPFDIVEVSVPLNGLVTVYARHIAFRQSNIVVAPFSGINIRDALSNIMAATVNNQGFILSTLKTNEGAVKTEIPASMRSVLMNVILPAYGGELSYGDFATSIVEKRGAEKGLRIEYGKNLISLNKNENNSETYDGVYPYYYVEGPDGAEGTYVELPEKIVSIGTTERVKVLDVTSMFPEMPTEEEIRAAATEYLDTVKPNAIARSIELNFALLSQTEEYKHLATDDTVELGDMVNVFVPNHSITEKMRVVEVEYDSLRDRYTNIVLGQRRKDIIDTIISAGDDINSLKKRGV